jgi:hypothetical protein
LEDWRLDDFTAGKKFRVSFLGLSVKKSPHPKTPSVKISGWNLKCLSNNRAQ